MAYRPSDAPPEWQIDIQRDRPNGRLQPAQKPSYSVAATQAARSMRSLHQPGNSTFANERLSSAARHSPARNWVREALIANASSAADAKAIRHVLNEEVPSELDRWHFAVVLDAVLHEREGLRWSSDRGSHASCGRRARREASR